jgi:putative tryptophan/tyrosine transport system substrate-binding protein
MTIHIQRRDFIVALGSTAALPIAVRAQQPMIPVIGFLHHASPEVAAALQAAFQQGLRDLGFIENKNVRIEYRWAENHYDRLPRREVAVIMTNTPTIHAAKAATGTIPIVFVSADDPVAMGLVASFNRPGGNATGVYFLLAALEAKRAELLHALVPNATTFALIVDPNFPSAGAQSQEMQEAVRSLGLNLLTLKAGTTADVDTAFATLVRERADAVAIAASGFFFFQRDRLVALATQYRLPAVYPWRDAVSAGGLMSYGASPSSAYRQAGVYAGRILKGENPSDLPVEQSVKVELVINLKAAKALGIIFPITLLGRADEVVE